MSFDHNASLCQLWIRSQHQWNSSIAADILFYQTANPPMESLADCWTLPLLILLGLILDVDLRSHENNLAHHTREIDLERLIVRRGQPFTISLQCSDSLPPKPHLELVLHRGEFSLNISTTQRKHKTVCVLAAKFLSSFLAVKITMNTVCVQQLVKDILVTKVYGNKRY